MYFNYIIICYKIQLEGGKKVDYLKILGFQLNVQLDCDYKNEFLIETEALKKDIECVKEIIKIKNPDIIIFPEMCYIRANDDYYNELSNGRLVIAGSIYNQGINITIVYKDGKQYCIPKYNASGSEPMIRNIRNGTVEEFMKNKLDEHTFYFNDKKLIILNCMEYYQNAHYIARSVDDLFGIICICSNNNPRVFLDESRVIHNHREDIYTFMVNCVSTYQGKDYGKGESYIYGPIQGHEKEWLLKEGILMDDYVSSILKLGNESEYFYGEFINDFSRFGRSDNYMNNPKNIEVGMIRKKVLKK